MAFKALKYRTLETDMTLYPVSYPSFFIMKGLGNLIRITRAQMLYLADVLPYVQPTIVNRGRRKGHRHYYVEPSDAVITALDENKFHAWYLKQPRRKVV